MTWLIKGRNRNDLVKFYTGRAGKSWLDESILKAFHYGTEGEARRKACMFNMAKVRGLHDFTFEAEEVMTTVKERMLSMGYCEVGTGGGCVAWEKTLPTGHYIWITDEGGAGLGDKPDEVFLVGLYSPDGEHWVDGSGVNLDAVLVVAGKWEENPAAYMKEG